ncbi:MAG: TonB-dependent receptor [Acidobacteria bacterium]|nr:TonB-dependent receptor [Acidobacteriota bacterium]MYJ02743.1 TonB-dependent receptor [Acidobacteriota bacterium]
MSAGALRRASSRLVSRAPCRSRCYAESLHRLLGLSLLVCGLLPVPANGEAARQDGLLSGRVADATGLALPGVTVEARDATGAASVRSVVSDATGRFAFPALAPAMYDVTFTLPGFVTEVRRGVAIGDSGTTTLDIVMTAQFEERVVVVGSRAQPRSVTESTVPIDAIPYEEIASQGHIDVGDQLRTLVPSYNVNPQPVGDAARIMRPANLRGLAPDHTLVLINGKRRHRGAVITWIGNGVSDGAQGPDISAIPPIALRQVEVLRDGAAAQYGSDAIAGVLNFLLKDAREGGSLELHTGGYAAGDGGTYTVAGNAGLPLGRTGFANLSLEYGNARPTSRSVQRDDALALVAAGNDAVRDPAQISGSPRIDDNLKLWGNFGYLFDGGAQFYGHANYAGRRVEGGFFFRNPNTRAAVFSGDQGRSLLIGDVLDARDGIPDGSAGCPVVPVVAARPDQAALTQVLADPNCFSFQERFPGGFTPQFGGDVLDASLVAGMRGQFGGGILWDASASAGVSEADFFIYDTVNASLGPATPTTFDPGLYRQEEIGLNVDLSYPVSDRVHLAGGAEWRDERFTIGLGDEPSWQIGPYAPQGFSAGSNGFPGFSPIAAGAWSRANTALYGEVELRGGDDAWTLGSALRLEDFEDFGTTANGKVSGRYRLGSAAALRASVSSGFRAPTPGQQNAFNVSTEYDHELMDLVNNGTIPSTSRVAELRGGEPLQPERSLSQALGTVVDAGPFSLTVDYFRIRLADRLALTQLFALEAAEVGGLLAEGVTSARNLQNFRFFTNHFETRTQGLDIVATYAPPRLGGRTTFGFLFNRTATTVTRFDPSVLDALRVRELQEAIPGTRWNASVRQQLGRWGLLGRVSYYDDWFDSRDLYLYHGDAVVDLEVAYAINDAATLTVGGRNAFGNDPEENPIAGEKGNRFSVQTPFGANGAFYYVRINYEWTSGG